MFRDSNNGNSLRMYEYILQIKVATLLAATVLAFVASALAGNPRVVLRSLALNYGPAFASAFFVVGVFYDGRVSHFDLTAGFLFEFSVLLAFTRLLCDALRAGRGTDERDVELWLRWSLVLQLLFVTPLITSEGFGIFSEGSRIAYLNNSVAAKFLTYAGILLAPIQAGLIARRLSGGRLPSVTGYAVILNTFVISMLSGSKGAAFLWLISMLALVDYRQARIRWIPVLVGTIAASTALVFTASIVSETLGISEVEFAELAVSRFFLNNDARALAFDYGGTSGQLSELIAASFRSLSMRFGNGPIDPPLGLLLFEQYFGVSTGYGSNASLIALITYYSARGYTLISVLIAGLGLAAVYGAVVGLRRIVRGPIRKMAVTLMGTTVVQQFSQDFLAFQLLVPLVSAAGLLFILTNPKYVSASPRRLTIPT
jgi:hypothetical protein